MDENIRELFTKSTGRKVPISVTIDADIVGELDEISAEFGLNRSVVVNTILRDVFGPCEVVKAKDGRSTNVRLKGKAAKERNEEVVRAFVEDGLTTNQLAARFNLSTEYIRQILKEADVWETRRGA